MSDLYLIDVPLNDQIEMVSHLKWAGVLVKVEPCVHGNYSPHIVSVRPDKVVCDGKPRGGSDV